jgi:hypothetical protein
MATTAEAMVEGNTSLAIRAINGEKHSDNDQLPITLLRLDTLLRVLTQWRSCARFRTLDSSIVALMDSGYAFILLNIQREKP